MHVAKGSSKALEKDIHVKKFSMIVGAGLLVLAGMQVQSLLITQTDRGRYATSDEEVHESYETIVAENEFRQGTVEDYNRWMEAFVQGDGTPVSYSSGTMHTSRFFVATKNFRMRPLFGADAIEVIVPEDVKYLGGELAHSTLYFMKVKDRDGEMRTTASDSRSVVAYDDTTVNGVKTVRQDVMTHLRTGSRDEYDRWAQAQVAEGHRPLGYYPDRFFVAKNSFEILPMYGASSITVLVPGGIEVTGDALGHNDIYELK